MKGAHVSAAVTAAPQRECGAKRTGIHVAGSWRRPVGDRWFAVDDPATGEHIASVGDAGPPEARSAIEAAAQAQPSWARTAARERSQVLRRTYEMLIERRDELAELITSEMGKPIGESLAEVTYGAEFLRWFAEEAVRIDGRCAPVPEGTSSLTVVRRPVGPCYLVTPWNFPLAMVTRKVAPALAAGCTLILKPADLTPLTAMAVVDILTAAGAPPGTVNLLTTTQPAAISDVVMSDSRLRKISFTGSTAVGRELLAKASERVLRTSMELGGNAPFIVLEGADLNLAVECALAAKFRNAGQACTAANRFLVHESLAAPFARELGRRASGLKLGAGSDPSAGMGPLITDRAANRAQSLVEDAVSRGARMVAGGRRVGRRFFEATVLSEVPAQSRVLREEIFAPIAPISTFRHHDEAIRLANDTDYGLVAYVISPTLERAEAARRDLEVGMVGINTGLVSNAAAPFGGAKQSGLGREGGTEGIDEYLALQYVATPRS